MGWCACGGTSFAFAVNYGKYFGTISLVLKVNIYEAKKKLKEN